MTDKRQAIIDAINAVIEARSTGKGNDSLPGGEIDQEIDPDLLTPDLTSPVDDNENVEINDPDHVLEQQKENQKNNSSNNSSKDNQNQKNTSNSNNEESGLENEQDEANDEQSDEAGENGEQNSNMPLSSSGSDANADSKNNKEPDIDPEYVAAWNEIMDRFDDDSISDTELEKLLQDLIDGKITSI